MIEELRAYLATLPSGPITETGKLEQHLAGSWHEFAAHGGGMDGNKLHCRMENVTWEPPWLVFQIERHGGTVHGSSRAEMQEWSVEVDKMTATYVNAGHRQLRPMQPPLKVKPLIEEIVKLIVGRQKDERLRWSDDGHVKVLVSKVLPTGSLVKQTITGRRKRFRKALDDQLNNEGWISLGKDVFAGPEG